MLWSAFGAGALLGLATIPVVSRLRPGIALAGNALLWGATLLPLVAMLGWVFGVRRGVTAAAAMLGAAAGGLLLDRTTPSQVIGLSAVTCILAGTAALCSPALHRLPTRPFPVDTDREGAK